MRKERKDKDKLRSYFKGREIAEGEVRNPNGYNQHKRKEDEESGLYAAKGVLSTISPLVAYKKMNSLLGLQKEELVEIKASGAASVLEDALITAILNVKNAQDLANITKLVFPSFGQDTVSTDLRTGFDEDLITEKHLHKTFYSRARHLLLYGGRDSTKSYGIAQKIVNLLRQNTPFRGALIRRSLKACRDSQYKLISDVISACGVEKEFKFVSNTCEIVHLATQNSVKGVAIGDGKSQKVRGLQGVHFAWYEEIATDLITFEEYLEIEGSLRALDPRSLCQSIYSFNSDNEEFWGIKYFFGDSLAFEDNLENIKSCRENTEIYHFYYKDNPFITDDRIAFYEGLKDISEHHYRTLALGYIGQNKSLRVFPDYFLTETPQKRLYTCYGVDFGFNSPMVLVEVKVDQARNVYVREFFRGLKKTPYNDLAPFILQSSDIDKSCVFWCDNSNPLAINELKAKGINAQKCSKNRVEMFNFAKNFKIHISPCSIHLIKEFAECMYVPKFDGTPTDVPVKLNDHGIDATLYAMFTDTVINSLLY